MPVLGFNSGKYDLNLIKQYIVDELSDTCTNVKVATKVQYNVHGNSRV